MLTSALPAGIPADLGGLGDQVRYYPVRKLLKLGSLAAFILCLAGGTAAFIYGIVVASSAYWRHGAAVLPSRLTVPLLIGAGLCLLALLFGELAYVNWNRGVLLGEKGLEVRSRKGVQSWLWEDIASVQVHLIRHIIVGIYSGTTHEYTLLNSENERLVLTDSFERVEELAEAVQKNVFPRLYESAAQQYNEGKPLSFGPVVISRFGLHVGKDSLPWGEIGEVCLRKGELKVSRKEGDRSDATKVRVPSIPNLRVLLALIDQVVGLKAD